MIGVVFPGHGAEQPKMALDWIESDEFAASLVELAGAEADFDALRMLRRGGPRFHDTTVVQPLLTAVTLALLDGLTRVGFRPDFAAGHSLGELSAWSAAGGLDAVEAVRLAAARGRILGELCASTPGAMLSLRVDEHGVEAALALGRGHGRCDLGVHNGPTSWVLTGDEAALRRVSAEFGGTFVRTTGPWHSRALEAGLPAFRDAIEARTRHERSIPIAANHTGDWIRPGDEFESPFVEQMCGTVRWADCAARMQPATDIVMVGPSKVLASLLRDNWPADDVSSSRLPRLHRVESARDIGTVLEALGV